VAPAAQTARGPNEAGKGWFGASVALSSDGNTALIGGPHDDGRAGAAWTRSRGEEPREPSGGRHPAQIQGVGLYGQGSPTRRAHAYWCKWPYIRGLQGATDARRRAMLRYARRLFGTGDHGDGNVAWMPSGRQRHPATRATVLTGPQRRRTVSRRVQLQLRLRLPRLGLSGVRASCQASDACARAGPTS
jgi:hypothetical protein